MKRRFFRECVFFVFFGNKNWKKRVHGRIPWAQNSGNPCAKLIISVFCLNMRFFVFRKSMKNDDFRSPFGRAPVVFLVIFIKFLG